MLPRAIILTLVPVLCAACANEHAPKVMGYQAAASPLAIAPATTATTPSAPASLPVPVRKSMADKVLTAIALERVTGRKPDPARLAEAR